MVLGGLTGGNLTTGRQDLSRSRYSNSGTLAFGGYILEHLRIIQNALTEEYNGTTWAPGGNLGTARRWFWVLQEHKLQL
jgi:hypothetical protein